MYNKEEHLLIMADNIKDQQNKTSPTCNFKRKQHMGKTSLEKASVLAKHFKKTFTNIKDSENYSLPTTSEQTNQKGNFGWDPMQNQGYEQQQKLQDMTKSMEKY